jgi:hypothetical protein
MMWKCKLQELSFYCCARLSFNLRRLLLGSKNEELSALMLSVTNYSIFGCHVAVLSTPKGLTGHSIRRACIQ